MTKIREVYYCEICGNLVEVVGESGGTLVCCGQKMSLLAENTKEASLEKHIPVAQKEGNRLFVQVGSVPHPMIPEHYIGWIEVLQGNKVQRAELQPGMEPKAEFLIEDSPYTVRAWCNLHGLWKQV
ncbi:MAG: desulfoferrodoxin [Planctomycetia bacterium]|nr:desulfoferrodoxin [Planctomycetia bacterium]